MLVYYLQMIDSPEEKTKFELLYIEYRGLMYHVAYEILKNEMDAEDAVHQAFLKVIENIKNVDEPVCPRTKSYLVTIVENRAIDMCRYRKLHEEVPYDDETIGIQYEYEGSDVLKSCLAKLLPRQRELLDLKYNLGFNNKDIARMMGLTLANTRQVEKRAKDKLFKACREEGLL